jgi:DNA-directed RNA polymerase specialized sigma subunit
LRSIGDIFGLSRMRICQIEKSIIARLKEEVLPDLQETCDLE